MATVRLFEHAVHANLYSKYRPTYPQTVVKAITSYVTIVGGSLGLALDVACGSGQSTFYLKDTFKQIIGVDISKAQVEEAKRKCTTQKIDNILFRLGNGTELPIESDSVDVVTIAQALHWLDRDKFFAECKRVLKHKGCLVAYGYGNVCLVNEQCNTLVSNFYRNTLQGCWHDARSHIDDEFHGIHLPFSNTKRVDMRMSYESSLEAFIGYVSSWSGYQKYCEDHPDNVVLENLHTSMKRILESNRLTKPAESNDIPDSAMKLQQEKVCGDTKVEAYFPVFVLLGQKT